MTITTEKNDTLTRLTALGFCGADDSVHPELLALISHAYPRTEFGVLFRPDKEGEPRYASPDWVARLGVVSQCARANHHMRLAAHLCGSRVNDLLRGHGCEFLEYLKRMGFQRVQINATAINGVDVSQLAESVPILWDVIRQHPQLEFILQKNEETKPLWQGVEQKVQDLGSVENLAMLVDESKGTGVLSSSWPEPSKLYKTGYAGGIGPQNVKNVLVQITAIVETNTRFWIDMESSLRSTKDGKDVFDLEKCYAVIDAVCQLNFMDRPDFLNKRQVCQTEFFKM